jgi:ABC-type microcin C transport system permease subunit YejB
MLAHLIRRALYAVPIIFGIAVITFVLTVQRQRLWHNKRLVQ